MNTHTMNMHCDSYLYKQMFSVSIVDISQDDVIQNTNEVNQGLSLALYSYSFPESGFFFAGLTLGRSLTNAKTVAKPLNAPLCYR